MFVLLHLSTTQPQPPCSSKGTELQKSVHESPELFIPDSHWCTTLLSRHPCFPSTGLYHTADLSPAMWLWHWSRMWTTAILNLYCLSNAANICLGTRGLLKREFPPPLKKARVSNESRPSCEDLKSWFTKPVFLLSPYCAHSQHTV